MASAPTTITPTKATKETELTQIGITKYIYIRPNEIHHGIYTSAQILEIPQLKDTYHRLTKNKTHSNLEYVNKTDLSNKDKWTTWTNKALLPRREHNPDENKTATRQIMEENHAHKTKIRNYTTANTNSETTTGSTMTRRASTLKIVPLDGLAIWTTTKTCAIRTIDSTANLPQTHPLRTIATTIRGPV